jgi:hypothetical protein
MRLGLYPRARGGSKVRDAYGTEIAYERHRHRFEVNNAYRERLDAAGMRFSGVSPDGRLVEYIELRDHPWFVATQAHPELKSRPNRPHPLFRDFVGAAAGITDDERPAPSRRRSASATVRDHPVTSRAPARRRAPPLAAARRRRIWIDRSPTPARAPRSSGAGSESSPLPARADRRLDDRMAREQAYAAYGDALEALNPLYESRLAAWRDAGDVRALAAKEGTDPVVMAADLERLSFNIETPYFAALRRYLALIGIEQGDAAEPDLWYIERGSSWSSWFGPREVSRALVPHGAMFEVVDLDGWRAVGVQLRGEESDVIGTAVVGAAYATLIGDPAWLGSEIGVTSDHVAAFVDFATFVRLLHLRRAQAELTYELRLYTATDTASSARTSPGSSATSLAPRSRSPATSRGSIGRSGRSAGWRRHCLGRCWSRSSRPGMVRAGTAIRRRFRSSSGSVRRRRWRTPLSNSGMMPLTGDPSCVRSGRGSSAR